MLLAVMGVALAQDQALSDQDIVYIGFQSNKPFAGSGPIPQLEGYFVAAKFWLLDGSGVPAAQPNLMYATAYLPSATGTKELFRAAFNGTTLQRRDERFGPVYHVKRTPEPFENWISWYTHLSSREFPKVVAFDSFMGARPEFNLQFPLPYKLVVPDRLVLGANENTLAATAMDSGAPAPADASFKIYPNTGALGSSYYGGNASNLTSPQYLFPKDSTLSGSPGWELGAHSGLAGFSACNEQIVNFEGGKKYVFRACTIMVKPVNFVVQQPAP
jgi:hypothetical protein